MEAVLALWDPNGEYTPVRAQFDSQTYRGHRGMRRYLSDLVDSWAKWRCEVEEVFEVSPDTVVATFRFHATGNNSSVPIETRLGVVFVLSRGKVLRGESYPNPDEALKAAGLAE
jgi:ketosteroid isomerase-like protein